MRKTAATGEGPGEGERERDRRPIQLPSTGRLFLAVNRRHGVTRGDDDDDEPRRACGTSFPRLSRPSRATERLGDRGGHSRVAPFPRPTPPREGPGARGSSRRRGLWARGKANREAVSARDLSPSRADQSERGYREIILIDWRDLPRSIAPPLNNISLAPCRQIRELSELAISASQRVIKSLSLSLCVLLFRDRD